MRSIKVSTLALLMFGLQAFAHDTATGMHISTKSQQAHVFFEKGLQKMEMLHTQDGLASFRSAVQADPQFALGHIFLTFFSQDPTEQVAEREKALVTRSSAGPYTSAISRWGVSSMPAGSPVCLVPST